MDDSMVESIYEDEGSSDFVPDPAPVSVCRRFLTVANTPRLEIKGKSRPEEARRLQSRSQEPHSDDFDQQIGRETRCLQKARQTGDRR
jgi:hypothetical protein